LVKLNKYSIVEGLNKLLDDKEYCRVISENGIDLVKNKYNIDLVAKQLFSQFEKIIEK